MEHIGTTRLKLSIPLQILPPPLFDDNKKIFSLYKEIFKFFKIKYQKGDE
jgi:hypothetical protein